MRPSGCDDRQKRADTFDDFRTGKTLTLGRILNPDALAMQQVSDTDENLG